MLCNFLWRFSACSTKSKMVAKISCHSLQNEMLHGFVSCLVKKKNPTLVVCWLVFGVIMLIKTYFFTFYRILADISVLLILAIIKMWLYRYTAQILSFGYAHWPWENCQENCFSFFQQDGQRITCYSHELLHRFVPRKQLTLDICLLHFGVILTSHFCVVYIKKSVTVLYFSVINVIWLLNLCVRVETIALPLRQI